MLKRKAASFVIKRIFSLLVLPYLVVLDVGCSNNNSTEPSDQNNNANPPNTPYLFNILPTGEEPDRGMLVCIDGGFDNIDGFVIQRKQGGSQFASIANINQYSPNIEWTNEGDLIYIDWNNIGVSVAYTYRVQAYNQDGSSDWSNERTGTSAGAQTRDLNAYATADAHVGILNPNTNYGSLNYISVTGTDPGYVGGGYEEALVLFSLPDLPSYAEFESAEIRLCEAGGGNTTYPGTIRVWAGLLAESWNEHTVIFNNRPGSWLGTYSYGEHNPNNQQQRCVYIDVSESISKQYNGIYPNHGFVFFTDFDSSYCSYYSREGYSSGSAFLTITYLW